MNPLRTIVRDLVERRLWPVAALMVALVIAVPVLFLRPAPSALDGSATPAAPTAAPATGTAATTTATTTPATTDVAAEPSVKLTTSPFSAAFGAGTSLPPSMEGLLKSTEGGSKSAAAAAVASAPLHDPFAAPASSATTTSPAPAAPAASASTRSTTTTTPSAPASTTTPPTQSSPFGGGNSSPAPTTTSTPAATTPATDKPAADSSGTVFHADVSFGTTATAPVFSDARRLTAFPSSLSPIAVYLGVMRGGWGAAFALKEGTQPIGAPSCRPRKQICGWVILHPGESVTLNDKDAVTGAVTAYTLKLVKITHESVTSAAAQIANGKASTSGRCLLGPLAAYRYDADTGTLAARPELKSCKYVVPGQDGQAASVRNVHIG